MPDDVGGGCVQYLSTFSDLTALLGSFPSSDTNANFAGKPWIFKNDLLITMEGTGKTYGAQAAALVCSPYGGWAVPEPLTTPRFNRLSIEIYVDVLRDSNHQIQETSGGTIQRGQAVFVTLNRHLHRTNPDMVMFGDLRTVGCQLLSEPQFSRLDDGDGLMRGQAMYGCLVFGDTAVLT